MSRKTPDWRKLVGKPTNIASHADQPTTPMIRTYHIGKAAASFTRIGDHYSAHVFSYRELVRLMQRVERVRETNTSIMIVQGQGAIHATVCGSETPQELKVRLRGRRASLKRSLHYAAGNRVRAFEKAETIQRELDKIEPLLARKPAAKKRKPK